MSDPVVTHPEQAELTSQAPRERTLVIVSGSGRSGTSTIAGALKKLGLDIPQPEISPNEANPRGYFEPAWVVDFHKRILSKAEVKTNDGRPYAWDLVQPALPAFREELETWLSDQLGTGLTAPETVVKDPRSFWALPLWREVASAHGMRTTSLTLLRHPAEVAGSRELHYLKGADEERRRARETGNVAGWLNVVLSQEHETRDLDRAYALYTDLITDWRKVMGQVGQQLGLSYDLPSPGTKHPIDDFIDVELRRSQREWSDLDVPKALVDLAEETWRALSVLVSDPGDGHAINRIDRAREHYARLHTHAAALVQDQTEALVRQGRRELRRKLTSKHREQLAATKGGQGPDGGAGGGPRELARKVAGRLSKRTSGRDS